MVALLLKDLQVFYVIFITKGFQELREIVAGAYSFLSEYKLFGFYIYLRQCYRHIIKQFINPQIWNIYIYKETHCITNSFLNHSTPVNSSRFRVGSSFREENGTIHYAAQIAQHPLYDWWYIDFDISVVRVSVGALLCLSSSGNYFQGPKNYSLTLNHTFAYMYRLLLHHEFLKFYYKFIYISYNNLRINSDYLSKHF